MEWILSLRPGAEIALGKVEVLAFMLGECHVDLLAGCAQELLQDIDESDSQASTLYQGSALTDIRVDQRDAFFVVFGPADIQVVGVVLPDGDGDVAASSHRLLC